MPAPQPIAVFGDTVTFVILLFAARYLVVAFLGEAGRAGFVIRWLRRIAIVAVILLVLRLASIAVARPEIAVPILWATVAILAATGAMLMADNIVMSFLGPWARRRRRS